MCWPPHRSITGSTRTRFNGPGPITRCGSGSPGTPAEFLALLVSSYTRLADAPQQPGSTAVVARCIELTLRADEQRSALARLLPVEQLCRRPLAAVVPGHRQ